MGVGGVGRVRVTQYWYRRLLYIQMWDKNKMNPVFAGPGVEVCTRFQFCYSAYTQRTQMKTKPQKEAPPPPLYGVTTIRRLLRIIGLSCRIPSL